MTITAARYPSGGGNPFIRPVLLRQDDDPVQESPPTGGERVLPREQILKLTGITPDTLNRWAREGHVKRHGPVPAWPWYDLAEVRQAQQQMASRRGGRPIDGLGTYPDVAALDRAVANLMSSVVAQLTACEVDPDAAVRAVKRWTRTVHNRPGVAR